MNFLSLRFNNLGISTKKIMSIIVLVLCIFISLYLSDIPFIVNMQNKDYYNKIIKQHNEKFSVLSNENKVKIEGMTDISANNIISDIINDSPTTITPFEQLIAIKQIAKMGSYSQLNQKTLIDIIDSSGNSDSTKVNNLNRFINTYVSGSRPK
jgi:hypothetical protein